MNVEFHVKNCCMVLQMQKKMITYIIFLCLAAMALLFAGCAGPSAQPPAAQAPAAPTALNAPAEPKAVPVSVPILMYHSISEEKNNDAVIAKELFAEQMAFLSREKFNPITLDELYAYVTEGKPLPAKPVVLTFDDGYRDTYEIVYPILKRYGFASTLFIPATFIGERLTLAELKEMKASGMAIMSHSLTHRELAPMTAQEQAEEIIKSKQQLDSLLAQDTRYFCYPNGSYNADTLRLLREQGFKLAVTIEPGWVKPGDERLTLKRVWIGNSVTLPYFKERVTRSDYTIL